MGEPADVRGRDGDPPPAPCGDPRDERQLGVGGGQEDDVGGRQGEIDGGVAIVDTPGLADGEMHNA